MTTPDHIQGPPLRDDGPLETMARAMEPLVSEDMAEPFKSAWLADLASSAAAALTEAGYAIVPVSEGNPKCEADCARHWTGVRNKNARLTAALKDSVVAIDDWLNTYAADMCDEERVKEAKERIFTHGGTLAYIARIQQTNRAILKACAPIDTKEGE